MRALIPLCAIALLLALSSPAWASKFAANSPYVATMDMQTPFYARCIPDQAQGETGVTQVLRVQKGADELIHTYPWFNKNGIVIGWSPTAGKVALMRHHQQISKPADEQIELSFYLGDQFLKSYTTADLIKMGAKSTEDLDISGRQREGTTPGAKYTSPQCRQVWNTNDYYFSIKISDTDELKFDVLTGKPCRVENDSKVGKAKMTLIQ